jgi:hypothetical protein
MPGHSRKATSMSSTSPAERERTVTAAVLHHVLDLHPVQVTVAELIRELGRDPTDSVDRDDHERAVLDLAGVGLLHRLDPTSRLGSLVLPTRAALVSFDLWDA